MIDLPVGKALIAVYVDAHCKGECGDEDSLCPHNKNCCEECDVKDDKELDDNFDSPPCECLSCTAKGRRDGRQVVYKLVDWCQSLDRDAGCAGRMG